MPGTDYDSAIYVHICHVLAMAAAYENQALANLARISLQLEMGYFTPEEFLTF